jgi:NTE family protein
VTVSDAARCDLVLGGGGVRGAAHIGALTALEESGFSVVRAAGASAGAIAGAFAVAGVPATTLRELFVALDLTRFVFADVVGRLRTRRGVGRLVERWADQATEPLAWLTEILTEQGIETFGDLKVTDPDATGPPERRYRLVVRCLDVLQRRVVRLPWDYARYGLDPDFQPVAQAVRASMSVPLVYDPVEIGRGGTTGLLIDGGLTSGFPVTILDRQDGVRPRWPTFGIRLLPRAPANGEVPDGGLALARMVVDALLDANDLLEPLTVCDERRTVRIDLSQTRQLYLADEQEEDMFVDGHATMTRFLADWDFDAYLHDCHG